MRIKPIYYKYIVPIVLILVVIIFGINVNKRSRNPLPYNNEIFTKKVYENLKEIQYWNGGENITISNKKDIRSIYNLLASLKISKASAKDVQKDGHILIKLVLHTKTISFGILSDEIYMNNERYDINKDVITTICNIVLKHAN